MWRPPLCHTPQPQDLPPLSQVIRHEPYGTGCDVYSFAILCWEMITYSIPFPRRSPVEVAPLTMTLPTHYALLAPTDDLYCCYKLTRRGVALGSQNVTIPCLPTLPLAYQHCPLPTNTAPTDSKVALAVANEGLRPQMPSHAPPIAAEMIESCWQQDPQLRPSFEQARHSEYSRSK